MKLVHGDVPTSGPPVDAAFPGWSVTSIEPSRFRLPKPLELVMRPDEHWYRLRRRLATPLASSAWNRLGGPGWPARS